MNINEDSPQEIVKALDYWKSKCADGNLPSRRDIDPTEIPTLLPWLSIVEIVAVDDQLDYRMRLEGTGVASAFERDITGKCASEIYSDERLAQIREMYRSISQAKSPRIIEYKTMRRDIEVTYQRLILPLATDGNDVDFFLVMFAFPDPNMVHIDPLEPGISKFIDSLEA